MYKYFIEILLPEFFQPTSFELCRKANRRLIIIIANFIRTIYCVLHVDDTMNIYPIAPFPQSLSP